MENDQTPEEYFEVFLGIVQEQSIRGHDISYPDYTKPAIDWGEYRSNAWDIFNEHAPQNVQDPDMANVLQKSLKALEDGHSFCPDYYKNLNSSFRDATKVNALYAEKIDNVGYVRIPQDVVPMNQWFDFADNIRQEIIDLDNQDLKGWVIDLRASYGGSMLSTLSALTPFFPKDEPMGYFLSPNKEPTPWHPMTDFSDGRSLPDYQLKSQHKPVAVLSGAGTSSAGEAILTAFVGLPHVKIIGSETGGQTTGNTGFNLSDGRCIAITNGIYADRNMNAYGGKIKPDISVEGNFDHVCDGGVVPTHYDPTEDSVVQTAVSWVDNPVPTAQCSVSKKPYQPQ